jgi:hypothetical protein
MINLPLRLFGKKFICRRNFVWHWINFVKIAAISHSWVLKITGALLIISLGNPTWLHCFLRYPHSWCKTKKKKQTNQINYDYNGRFGIILNCINRMMLLHTINSLILCSYHHIWCGMFHHSSHMFMMIWHSLNWMVHDASGFCSLNGQMMNEFCFGWFSHNYVGKLKKSKR